jgi:hypothetical protein
VDGGGAEKDGEMSFSLPLCFLSVSALKNGDQKKLLFRGITSFLEFQDSPGARKLVQAAVGKIKPETQAEV